jgi:hypothetical protein
MITIVISKYGEGTYQNKPCAISTSLKLEILSIGSIVRAEDRCLIPGFQGKRSEREIKGPRKEIRKPKRMKVQGAALCMVYGSNWGFRLP